MQRKNSLVYTSAIFEQQLLNQILLNDHDFTSSRNYACSSFFLMTDSDANFPVLCYFAIISKYASHSVGLELDLF